jgi:hypothetical protein
MFAEEYIGQVQVYQKLYVSDINVFTMKLLGGRSYTDIFTNLLNLVYFFAC